MSRISIPASVPLVMLFVISCSSEFLEGKRCAPDGGCLAGYVCRTDTNTCVIPEEPDGTAEDGGQEEDEMLCPDTDTEQIVLTDVHLLGNGAEVNVEPLEVVDVDIDFAISQAPNCGNCTNFFLFGLRGDGYGNQPLHCHRAGIPPLCPALLHGSISFDLTAPQTPGQYFLVSALVQDDSCTRAMANYYDHMQGRPAQAGSVRVAAPACRSRLFYLSDVELNGSGPELVVSAGSDVDFSSSYHAAGTDSCPQCRAMAVVGLDDSPLFCRDLGILPLCPSSDSGTLEGKIAAPSEPGTYTVRAAMYLNTSCQAAMDAYLQATPPRSATVALLEVTD
ncbi:MAG: hypothetical protein D6806_09960 [Deltaproteobacteria bacterium]|nr:MAG: hypothetical protein D6806_09960 [Deltaproteobacteria bacterium]